MDYSGVVRDKAFPFDHDGDGKDGIFLYRYNQKTIAKAGSEFPDLVKSISKSYDSGHPDDVYHQKTSFQYTPSSHYSNLFLPFIVQTLSSVIVEDGIGGSSTTNYTYGEGLFSAADREFRGFGSTTQINPNGTSETILFHSDYYRKARPQEVSFYAPQVNGGDLLKRTSFTWDTPFVWFDSQHVQLVQKRTEYYDDKTVFSQEEYSYQPDCGLMSQVITSGTGAENVTSDITWENQGDWIWRKTLESTTGATSGKVRETAFDYYPDNTGNLHYKTRWYSDNPAQNPSIEYTYDDFGNLETEIDARGNPTTIAYDTQTNSFPYTVTFPSTVNADDEVVIHEQTYESYDYRFGKPTKIRDQNDQLTTNSYDDFGRLKQVDTPDGGQVIYLYNDSSFPRSVITRTKESESNYIESLIYYDGFGRKVQTVNLGDPYPIACDPGVICAPPPRFIVSRTHYDDMGRVEFVAGPFFQSSQAFIDVQPDKTQYQAFISEFPYSKISYDHRSRLILSTSWDGQNGEVNTTYAYSGFETTVTDADQCTKTEVRDHLGRVTEVIEDPAGENNHTQYLYNAAGEIEEVRNALYASSLPDANRIKIEYDTLGRKKWMDDPDMGLWSYGYDANGNMILQTDAQGNRILFSYDELNRLKAKDYLDTPETTVAYNYDNTQIQNGKGRLFSITNGDVTAVVNAYDEMGRQLEVQKTIAGAAQRTMGWDYDFAGRVTRQTYPHTDASPLFYVDYAYHSGTNLLNTATGSDGTVYATISNYHPSGKISVLDFGNGVQTTYGYDDWSQRLTSMLTAMDGGEGLKHQDRSYYYTKAGNIEEIDDALWGEHYFYSYDELHRLTSETTSTLSLGVQPANLELQYNDPDHTHAVSDVTTRGATYSYTYDPNGNMTDGHDLSDILAVGQRTMEFNADGMPTSITHSNGNYVSVTYDGESKRAKKAGVNGSTYYFSDTFELVGTTETCYVFAGNLRVAMVKDYATVIYFHKDHLGSSTVLTSSGGNGVELTRYVPYGGKRGEGAGINGTNYLFTDQELDAESGLYNYGARLYDPVIGRFVSPDSVVPDWTNPKSLNRYAYCLNNPLIYVDPTGHDPSGTFQPPDWANNGDFYFEEARYYSLNDGLYGWLIGNPAAFTYNIFAGALNFLPHVNQYPGGLSEPELLSLFMLSPEAGPAIQSGGYLLERSKLALGSWWDDVIKSFNASNSGGRTLIHYTDEAGMNGMLDSMEMFNSTGVKHARFGDGQYFTDIVPEQIGGFRIADLTAEQIASGQKSLGQLSSDLFRVPWNTNKVSHFIEIDVTGLNVLNPRPGTFLIPNSQSLDLTNRIIRAGQTIE